MKLSLVSLAVVLSAGLVAAAPNPNPNPDPNPGWGNEWKDWYKPSYTCKCPPKPRETPPPPPKKDKKPPPPPPMPVTQVTQTCGNNNSPSCCNSDGGSHNVVYQGESFSMQCSPIAIGTVGSVQTICSTTVACCQGDGCIAIAG